MYPKDIPSPTSFQNHVSSVIYPGSTLIYNILPLKDGESSSFSKPANILRPDCKHTPELYSPLPTPP